MEFGIWVNPREAVPWLWKQWGDWMGWHLLRESYKSRQGSQGSHHDDLFHKAFHKYNQKRTKGESQDTCQRRKKLLQHHWMQNGGFLCWSLSDLSSRFYIMTGIRWGMNWSTLQCPEASSANAQTAQSAQILPSPTWHVCADTGFHVKPFRPSSQSTLWWLFDVLWCRCTLQPNSRLNVQQSDWRQRPKADGRSSDGRVCEMRGDNNARVHFLKFWVGLRLCLIVSWFAIG